MIESPYHVSKIEVPEATSVYILAEVEAVPPGRSHVSFNGKGWGHGEHSFGDRNELLGSYS